MFRAAPSVRSAVLALARTSPPGGLAGGGCRAGPLPLIVVREDAQAGRQAPDGGQRRRRPWCL